MSVFLKRLDHGPPNSGRGGWKSVLLGLSLMGTAGCFTPAEKQTNPTPLFQKISGEVNTMPAAAGPTLRLDYRQKDSSDSPIADFMYFVPLISPEPVTIVESPGNTQRARLLSVTHRTGKDTFSAVAKFVITGEGTQQNIFDHTELFRKNENLLREGTQLNRVLDRICIQGEGHGSVAVEGWVRNGVAVVTEVRMQFNDGSDPSPVTIELADFHQVNGGCKPANEMVARVNSLTFQRGTLPPRMAVTVGSVKSKDAGNGPWQKFVGNLTGAAANLLIKPIPVEAAGHEVMLDFGRALAAQEAAFTFPFARKLKTNAPPAMELK